MTTLHLRVGFMPLVDCALVVLAKDEGHGVSKKQNAEAVRATEIVFLKKVLGVD